MDKVLKFLQDAGVFFVSTVDDKEPKVRPFSFVMEYEGKICFGTSNKKPTYKQLIKNHNVEISAFSPKDSLWLRFSGQATFCTTREAKIKALEIMPPLKKMYTVEDNVLEIFYLENGVANICSMSGYNETINL